MKTQIKAATAALAACLFVAGCGGVEPLDGSTAAAKETREEKASGGGLSVDEINALTVMRTRGISGTDTELLGNARAACAGFEAGGSFMAVGTHLTESPFNLTITQAGTVIGVATSVYCPEYKGMIPK